jgi:hypothetical protein
MDKLALNISMNKFLLRLILITHILLIKKVPTDYLALYSELATRFLFVIIISGIVFYDLFSCALAGALLVLMNVEYLERKKLN